jgi:hypothetical protein
VKVCPNENELRSLLAGDPEAVSKWLDHVSECKRCRDIVFNSDEFASAAISMREYLFNEASCLDYQRLAGYMEHALSDADMACVKRHLALCPECRQDLQDLEAQDGRAQMRETITFSEPPLSGPSRRPWNDPRVLGVAAALAAVLVVLFVRSHTPAKPGVMVAESSLPKPLTSPIHGGAASQPAAHAKVNRGRTTKTKRAAVNSEPAPHSTPARAVPFKPEQVAEAPHATRAAGEVGRVVVAASPRPKSEPNTTHKNPPSVVAVPPAAKSGSVAMQGSFTADSERSAYREQSPALAGSGTAAGVQNSMSQFGQPTQLERNSNRNVLGQANVRAARMSGGMAGAGGYGFQSAAANGRQLKDGNYLVDQSGAMIDSHTGRRVDLPAEIAGMVRSVLSTGEARETHAMLAARADTDVLRGSEESSGGEISGLRPNGYNVRSDHPTLSWSRPEQDGKSTVIVFTTDGREVWEWNGRSSECKAEAPLKRGVTYKWRVVLTANGQTSHSKAARFRVLSEPESESLGDLANAGAGSSLVEGCILESFGVYDEALLAFKKLSRENPDSFVVSTILKRLEVKIKESAGDGTRTHRGGPASAMSSQSGAAGVGVSAGSSRKAAATKASPKPQQH